MKKFRVTAMCNPYNAKSHYHGEKIIRYDGITPVEWVMADDLTKEEAINKLCSYAYEDFDRSGYSYEDDNSITDLRKQLEENDCEDIDLSWYKGPGYYTDGVAVWLEGDSSYSYDVMHYRIEEYGEDC